MALQRMCSPGVGGASGVYLRLCTTDTQTCEAQCQAVQPGVALAHCPMIRLLNPAVVLAAPM
eukprot:4114485-Karenia_brevis.AAC.1